MSEHCISAFLKRQDEKAYKSYITDALKIITENTAKSVGGSMLTMRYCDIIDRSKPQDDEKTADEIIENIRYKLSMLG